MEGFPVPHAALSAWSAEKMSMQVFNSLSSTQSLKDFFQGEKNLLHDMSAGDGLCEG